MRLPRYLVYAVIVMFAGLVLVFLLGAFKPRTHITTGTSNAAAPVPAFTHIFIIVLENKAYDQVIGSQDAPYLNALARQYGLATNYYAIQHPSLPNYLALTGGDTFGIMSNCQDCFIDQPNLIDQLVAAGKSWSGYMESMPEPCFMGDALPLYRQKHNPFIYYNTIRTDPPRCNRIVPFTRFSADLRANALPDFVWITPNMCNDGHDCPLNASDAWLQQWVPQILQTPAWQNNGVLFITFDEGASTGGGCCTYAAGGRVATLVIAPNSKPGFASDVAYDHYSLLRTIEAAWKLPRLGKAACDCTQPMADFFRAPTPERW